MRYPILRNVYKWLETKQAVFFLSLGYKEFIIREYTKRPASYKLIKIHKFDTARKAALAFTRLSRIK